LTRELSFDDLHIQAGADSDHHNTSRAAVFSAAHDCALQDCSPALAVESDASDCGQELSQEQRMKTRVADAKAASKSRAH
jgi:hypothetical protein